MNEYGHLERQIATRNGFPILFNEFKLLRSSGVERLLHSSTRVKLGSCSCECCGNREIVAVDLRGSDDESRLSRR